MRFFFFSFWKGRAVAVHTLLFVTQASLVCVENVSLAPHCLPTYLVGLTQAPYFPILSLHLKNIWKWPTNEFSHILQRRLMWKLDLKMKVDVVNLGFRLWPSKAMLASLWLTRAFLFLLHLKSVCRQGDATEHPSPSERYRMRVPHL